jgi:hypothetical protein
MTIKSYLIGPIGTGLQNNIEPWLLPEDAFETLTNAYVWRGRVKKRFGSYYLGDSELKARLRIDLGNTDLNGDISTTVPGTIFAIGQMFSIGTEIFTVNATGLPATLLDTGSATLATYDTTTGALVITGADASTAVYFYPAQPVMGLRVRETSNINFENVVGFDTQFAYRRLSSAWDRLGTAIWTGTNSNFYWTINYRGASPYETYLYVVNGVTSDNIKYLPSTTTTWTNLVPQLNVGATRFLQTAKIIVGFKDRLVVLNTIELEGASNRSYVNRARWSQNGDPTVAATSWLDDTPGKGGYIDSSTQEAITTVEFIKDRLIVYYERSTWELVYTGDQTLPFRWQQINNELGAESTFSIIGFDKGAVGVGNVGVHTCNGVNVERIDEKIPNEVFKIHNGNDGPVRVYGIRDYFNELVYWTFPDATDDPTYPTKILVWNYQNNTWAFFDESFTCFGYFQKDEDLQWADLGARYGTWAEWNDPWNSSQSQSRFPDIIAGNQQGFVVVVDVNRSFNEQSLYITDMTTATSRLTVIDHNLKLNDYILVEDASGITSLNGNVYQVAQVINSDTIRIDTTFSGTYSGSGKLSRVSNIDIRSKMFNPGTPVGQQFQMPYIDFLMQRTVNGEVSLDYYLDSSFGQSIQDQILGDVLLGNNVLYTKPETDVNYQDQQSRIWHRYYILLNGEFIQIRFFMNDTQMRDLNISREEFVLEAILIYVIPGGRLIG